MKYLLLCILLLAFGCHHNSVAQEDISTPPEKTPKESVLDKQLKINRDALLRGSTEQMRLDAANVMLFDDAPEARGVLIEILEQSENNPARNAIFQALIQARRTGRDTEIKKKETFIKPLVKTLQTSESDMAGLAAEATLIFDYERISKHLERLATNASLPLNSRLNAIYALKLRHNINAVSTLVNLLDDPEERIKSAAKKALTDYGLSVPEEPEGRQEFIETLQARGNEEFLKDLLIHQETKVDKLKKEVAEWRNRYLSSLDKYYESLKDDKDKVSFLASHLTNSKGEVQLWALEKISQWRVGTSSKLPGELGPLLVELVSSPNKSIRLETARLLSLMGELSSAEKLIQQLEVEEDEAVKQELFVALGAACQYAFSPNSGKNISPTKVRQQTLELASEYLFEREPSKARNGAEVIKKLLKQDGLSESEVNNYLDLLLKRYNQIADTGGGGSLRGDLLSSAAELCVQGVPCAESAREKFRPIFKQALKSESALVREAAVTGLISIDKAEAFKTLREDFIYDSSSLIRQKVMNLAGERGTAEDLSWLSEKTRNASENEIAWQSMLNIFGRCEASILKDWINKFEQEEARTGVSDQQLIPFFELAEQKFKAAEASEMLQEIRENLANLYKRSGSPDRAAEYYGLLLQKTGSSEEKQVYRNELLNLYLNSQMITKATDLIHNYLLEKALEPNDVIVSSVERYLASPPEGADPDEFLKAFVKLQIPASRPEWEKQKQRWSRWTSGVTAEPNSPK